MRRHLLIAGLAALLVIVAVLVVLALRDPGTASQVDDSLTVTVTQTVGSTDISTEG